MSSIVNLLVPEITSDIREIIKELRNIRSKNIKIWIPQDVLAQDKQYNKSALIPLEKNINPDNSLYCYEWNVANTVVLPVARLYNYWIERYDANQQWVILTDINSPKQIKSLFLDAQHKIDLPDKWYRYQCFTNREALLSFCMKTGALAFALCPCARFSVAHGIGPVKGAKVYKENATGYYWHIDTMHEDHCEVYDSTRKHIGVADISTGIIDRNKAVKGRSI